VAIRLGRRDKLGEEPAPEAGTTSSRAPLIQPFAGSVGFWLTILFLTGFTSIGMEVVWTRAFTPITTTTVYAFALLLTTYLGATAAGSLLYRRHLRQN